MEQRVAVQGNTETKGIRCPECNNYFDKPLKNSKGKTEFTCSFCGSIISVYT